METPEMQNRITYGSIGRDPLQIMKDSEDGHTYVYANNQNTYEYRLAGTHEDTEEAEYSSTYPALSSSPHSKSNRRWSVMEKLEQRYYCRIRSCGDCGRILNCKCLLATFMLAIFIIMAVAFAHVLFFATEVGSVRFDYIIVGAGPAGSLLANRLVNSGATVLLLESGASTQYEVEGRDYMAGPVSRFDIPYMWPILRTFNDGYKWGKTQQPTTAPAHVPKPPSRDEEGGLVQARGLGGNGILSSMIYMRATPADIKSWGMASWTWDKMLRLYKGLEHFQGPSAPDQDVHGQCANPSRNQCQRITTAPSHGQVDEVSAAFLEAAKAAGMKQCGDFNDHRRLREGVGYLDFNIAGGVRDSAATRFLSPVLGEQTLVLEKEASVTGPYGHRRFVKCYLPIQILRASRLSGYRGRVQAARGAQTRLPQECAHPRKDTSTV